MITISDDDLIGNPVIKRGSWMETVNEIHGIYPLRILTEPVEPDITFCGSGNNNVGQLGIGNYSTDPEVPQRTAGFITLKSGTYIDIECGAAYSMALKSDGTLWGAGHNLDGQLGLGHKTSPQYFWIQELSESIWTMITCGNDTTYGIKSDGTLWACGEDRYGNMGQGNLVDGTQTFYDEFVQVGLASDWVYIEAQQFRLFAINSSGELWGCGYNVVGALGVGDLISKSILTQVGSDTDWASIGAGSITTIGLKTGGELYTWGDPVSGGLGNGTTTPRVLTPVQIGLDLWASIGNTAYANHAIKSDGTLWATGANNEYVFGNGTDTDSNIFIQIGSATDWDKLFGNWSSMIAIKTSGVAYGTGYSWEDLFGVGESIDNYEHSFIALGDVVSGTTDLWTKFSTWGATHYLGIRQ